MRGLPLNAQGKGGFEAAPERSLAAAGGGGGGGGKGATFWSGKGVIQEGGEPRSVLDHRSPSPQASTSTLSSSLCSGGSVVAVSDRPNPKWPLSDSAVTQDASGAAAMKEEWTAVPLPLAAAGSELVFPVGGEKFGLGVEDWEMMLSQNSAALAGQEQTFLRWIMGDVEDPFSPAAAAVLKQQQQQLVSHLPSEFDSNNCNLGFGILDSAFGLEPAGVTGGAASAMVSSLNPPPITLASTGGLSLMSGCNRIAPSPTPAIPNVKGATFTTRTDGHVLSPPLRPSSLPLNSLQQPELLSSTMFFHGCIDRPQLFGTGLVSQQPPAFPVASSAPSFLPLPASQQEQRSQPFLPSQLKRHHSLVDRLPPKPPFVDSSRGDGAELFLRRRQPQCQLQKQGFPNSQTYHLQQRSVKPKVEHVGDVTLAATATQQQHQYPVVDHLFEAAKMIEYGNSASARGILARLNQQLPSPLGQPLLRSAFYFKEALQLILANVGSGNPASTDPNRQLRGPWSTLLSSPVDVVFKLAAYKAFSEVSPVLQFTNFTCTQVLLEELSCCDHIHIVDFDIGIGGQWSSFMQELAQRRPNAAGSVRLLKITALVSSSSHHPLELHLTQESLSHFASDLNIPFQFNILSLDSFNPSDLLGTRDEAIAVNLPVGTAHNLHFPTLLGLIKQLSPKIVLSVDQGCDRSDLSFSLHCLHAFQSSVVLLESIDAAGTSQEVTSKVEKFLLRPRIENAVLGRHRATEKMLPWRTLFASSGFTPFQFSTFTESQAECLLKRVQVRGFHLEKHQTSLVLYWQRGELVSVSAWKC